MRILITGGAGFIGSHLADAYLAKGHDVAVLDSLVTGKRENLPMGKLSLFRCDIRERDAVFEAIRSFRPELISHHAAQLSVSHSLKNPHYDAECNVMGLINVLDAAVAVGARKFVFASSGGTVYGDTGLIPTPEDAPLLPLSPYGVSKLVGEHYLRIYHQAHGLCYTSLRYGNVYGPRQDPHGEAGVVAIFAQRMIRGESPTIHWDGEQSKDYVHVRDVVRANLLALSEGDGGTFNIGSGRATSVNELFAALEVQLRTGLVPQYAPKRKGDVRLNFLAIERSAREMGWQPEISLEEGLVDTLAFFRTQAAISEPSAARGHG